MATYHILFFYFAWYICYCAGFIVISTHSKRFHDKLNQGSCNHLTSSINAHSRTDTFIKTKISSCNNHLKNPCCTHAILDTQNHNLSHRLSQTAPDKHELTLLDESAYYSGIKYTDRIDVGTDRSSSWWRNADLMGTRKYQSVTKAMTYFSRTSRHYFPYFYRKVDSKIRITSKLYAFEGDATVTSSGERILTDYSSAIKNDGVSSIESEINQRILDTFKSQDRKATAAELDRLKKYLSFNEEHLSNRNILTLLNRCGRQKLNPLQIINGPTILRVLDDYCKQDQKNDSGDYVVSALRGLEFIPPASNMADKILYYLTKELQYCPGILKLESISAGLYSFRYRPSSNRSVYNMLRLIDEKLGEFTASVQDNDISPKYIAMALFGLQSMSSNNPIVRSILSKIVVLVRKTTRPFDSQAISNAFFGLRSSDSNVPVVIDIVDAIFDNIEKYNLSHLTSMSSNEFSMMVCGMQGLSSGHPSIVRVISTLSSVISLQNYTQLGESIQHGKVNRRDSSWFISTPMELGPLVAGMKSWSSSDDVTREFLMQVKKVISHQSAVAWRNQKWTEQHIANAFHGLQSLSSYHNETLALISALYDIVEPLGIPLSFRAIAASLNGFQSMSGSSREVQNLLRYFVRHLNNLQKNAHVKTEINSRQSSKQQFKAYDIAMACYGLQSLSPCQSGVVKALLNALSYIIENSYENLNNAQFAMAIYGLKSMETNDGSVIRILIALHNKWSVDDQSPMLTSQEVTMIMNGLRGMSTEHIIVESILHKLKNSMNRYREDYIASLVGSAYSFTANQFTTIFYSLQSMGGRMTRPRDNSTYQPSSILGYGITMLHSKRRHSMSGRLLQFLTVLTDIYELKKEPMTASMIATSLFGFQGMTCEYEPVRRLLMIFTDDLRDTSDMMTSQNIGNSIFGLQNMSSRSDEVRGLLHQLDECIRKSPATISPQAVGNSFYGLQCMSSEHEEVRSIVEALAIKVDQMIPVSLLKGDGKVIPQDAMLTGQNIGNALWGLRNMTSDSPEVLHALRAITNRIRESNLPINGQNIGNALYSLQAMTDESIEVKELLSVLAHKIVQMEEPLSGLDIAMALYGLKSMDHSSSEVRVILGALIFKIRNSDVQFQLRELTLAIIGILKTSPWIKDDFLQVLAAKTPGMSMTTEAKDEIGDRMERLI